MRVIAGTYGGRVLISPRAHRYRPTTDRVKESLFNILENMIHWSKLRVCDLFAGSGSLGIEALSRGAAAVTFVDSDRQSIAILRRNIETLALDASVRIETSSVMAFLARSTDTYDLMLADPPYDFGAYESLCGMISERAVLTANGMLVIEHHGKTALPAMNGWLPVDVRRYGTTAVSFLKHAITRHTESNA